jgi:hypothetical protein
LERYITKDVQDVAVFEIVDAKTVVRELFWLLANHDLLSYQTKDKKKH